MDKGVFRGGNRAAGGIGTLGRWMRGWLWLGILTVFAGAGWAATPPRIVTQPADVLAPVGGGATFSVTATGDGPLRYQWYRDLVFELVGATNSTLVLTNLQTGDSGFYQVVVENAAGVASSIEALLTVRVPPAILLPPASLVVTQGQAALFTVQAGGDGPLSYQWYFQATNPVPGAVSDSLLISSAQATDIGAYSVVVSNDVGVVRSVEASLGVRLLPFIAVQPLSLVVTQGAPVAFTVTAGGEAPLSYQWYFNESAPIPLATSPTFSLNAVSPGDAAGYSVVVSNGLGAVTSVVARLTVKSAPAIVLQPVSVVTTQGFSASFSAEASGSAPLSLQWIYNGVTALPGATNAELNLAGVMGGQAGTYALRASNDVGVVLSAAAILTVRVPAYFLSEPADRVVTPGASTLLEAVAAGDAPLVYQWWFNETNALPGATGPGLQLSAVTPAQEGRYSVSVSNAYGGAISRGALVRLKQPPFVSVPPSSLVVTQGNVVFFSVVAGGDAPFTYQWFFNGTNQLSGATNTTLVFFNATAARAGLYSVRIRNEAGEVFSAPATLTVRVPPSIVRHPASVAVAAGNTATFTVVAAGDEPLGYQWFFNQTNRLADATNAVLAVADAQADDEGRYSVVVTNLAGVAVSLAAELRLRVPPVITVPPASLMVTQGATVVFTVSVTGDGPFTYRWFRDATNLVSTANTPDLVLTNIQASAAGFYTVLASNSVGVALSPPAELIVRRPPVFVKQPAGGAAAPGGEFTFEVVMEGEEPFAYQWYFNGTVPVPTATYARLTLTNLTVADAGLYSVVVNNPVGSAVSVSAPLGIKRPPVILQGPASLTVTQGLAATFTVAVGGDGPFFYQWYRNETTPVLGGTGASLVLPSVGAADAGAYTVVVTNATGRATGGPAALTVLRWPIVVQQPVSLVATQGNTVEFSVTVASDTPVTHVWRRNGVALEAPNAALLVLTNVQPALGGTFDVVLRNDYGAVTSQVATLLVRGLDFGDAPDPAFPTLLASDGARHVVVPGVFLGTAVDFEPDGQPSAGADGDDLPLVLGEAGVRPVSPLYLGQAAQWQVVASTNGLLSAWVDWNGNGIWEHPLEQMLADRPIVPGTNLLSLPTPSGARVGPAVARFRFSTAGGLLPTGLAPDGEVEDLVVTPVAAANLRLGLATSASRIAVGANVTMTLSVTNAGPSSATAVAASVPLSPRSGFVSATSSQGACALAGGVVGCSLGTLNSGAVATVSVVVRAGSGTNETSARVSGGEFDPDLTDNAATRSFLGIVAVPAYVNGEATLLPELDPGPGTVYPIDITVSGWTSRIDKVVVTLHNLTHFWPDDLDILLVGPGGRKVLLMSDCGLDNGFTDLTLSFDDDAASSLPNSDPRIVAGTYKPTNFDRLTDDFALPAPPEPYVTNLSVFKGLLPNGTWSLYIMDDSPENLGYLTDGWSLAITLADPLADVAVAATGAPASVVVGNTATYSVAVTNLGPSVSPTSVRHVLPPGFVLVGATASQGACSNLAGTVVCEFGNIPVGGAASASLQVAPTLGGTYTNVFTVLTTQLDPEGSNNVASVVTAVVPVADVGIAALSASPTVLLGQTTALSLLLTNRGPNASASVTLTGRLPETLEFVSATGASGGCVHQAGVITCAMGPVAAGGGAGLTVVARALSVGFATNRFEAAGAELDFGPLSNGATNIVRVLPAADISVGFVSKRAQAVLSLPFLTAYAVSNAGPSSASVILTNALPSGLSFISAGATRGACTNVGGVVQCDLGVLGPGESVGVQVTARGTAFGTWTNVAGVAGAVADPLPANGVAVNEVGIIPGADLSVVTLDSADPVWLNETLTYTVRVTNAGPVSATAVTVTNRLPAGVTYVSAGLPGGACSEAGGEVRCSLPALGAGSNVVITVVARGTVPSPGTNVTTVAAAEFDYDLSNNVFLQPGRVVASSGVYSNNFPLTIPDLGGASLFPSTTFVAGLTAAVYSVRVGLAGLSHTYADDLDILLVGPGGQSTYLMSDVGGEFVLSGASLTFDDAGAAMPNSTSIASGQWRPTNFEDDTFPAPAPASGYATNLSVFAGTDPNGPWSLYIFDDTGKDRGSLAGWSLNFATVEPIADLRVNTLASANPLSIGSNLVLTIVVTNLGPATATDVRLTNNLDATLSGIGFVASQGGCALVGRQLSCALGSIAKDAGAVVVFTGTPAIAEVITNVCGVSARETDLRPSDNVRSLALDIAEPPVITVQPEGRIVTNGVSVSFSVELVGSAPFSFQWLRNGVAVPGATGRTLTFPEVNPLNSGSYQVRVQNRVGSVVSLPAVLQVIGPPTFSDVAPFLVNEDTSTGEVPFTIFDFETPAEQIELSGASSDTALVGNEAIVFGGSGSNRTVRVTPQPDASGSLTIFLRARDGSGGVTTLSVPMTIRPVNDAVRLSPFDSQATDEDIPVVLPFVVSDVETPADALQFRVDSGNPSVLAAAGAVFAGAGTNRVLTLTPVANASGTSAVTVVVTDADGLAVSNTFVLVVAAVNDVPTLDPLPDLVVAEDSGPRAVALGGITSGASNEVQNLQVKATSSNPSVIGPPSVDYASPATVGTLTFTPRPDVAGESVITVTVTDGGTTNYLFSRSFTVTVAPVPDAPVISAIEPVTTREDTVVTVPFTVSDPDSGALAVAVSASDVGLLPPGGLALGGSGANRSLAITPGADRSGTATLRLVVTDADGLSATNEFSVTVLPVNDPPTLAVVTDLSVAEDSGPRVVPLSGISPGAPDELQPVAITATSSNPSLIPNPVVAYASPATTGTLTFTPAANASGTSVITVTLDDGQPERSRFTRSFVVTVTPANDAPTISAVTDRTMLEDETNSIALVIGDAETPADLLVLTASSTNPSLVAATNITFSGSGSNRVALVAPRADQFGTATVSIRVSDGTATASAAFVLTVSAVNDTPTLDVITNLNVVSSPGTITVPLTGITSGATNENQTLVVSASTTNPGFFLNTPSVTYTSPSTTGTLSFRPGNNNTGTADITVTVTDGSGGNAVFSRTFVLTVRSSANVLPTISAIGAQTISEDAVGGPVAFTVRDAETAASALAVTALSTNPRLIPDGNIVLGGAGTNRTVRFTPLTNQFGSGTIILTVTDGSFGSSNLAFNVTVNPVNDAPTIGAVGPQSVDEDGTTSAIGFAIGDVETPADRLTVTASSSAPLLVPPDRIQLGGSGASRTVRISPAPDESGSAVITLRVTDGVATNTASFTLTVNPVNDGPVLLVQQALEMDEDAAPVAVPFVVFDLETPPTSLAPVVQSSNPGLVDASGLAIQGTGTNRSLVITPKADQFGAAVLELVVADGAGVFATNRLALNVRPVNDPPTLAPISDQVAPPAGVELAVPFSGITVGPANEVASQTARVSVFTDQPGLFGVLRVEHVAGATGGAVILAAAPGATGAATVTVVVNDGQAVSNVASRAFVVRFNQAPVIGYLPDVTTDEDVATSPVAILVTDADGPAEQVGVTGSAVNAVLLPADGFRFSGEGSGRTLVMLPATNQSGLTLVRVMATDAAGAMATNSFYLTVRSVVDPIVIRSQPQDVVALVGGNPSFSVVAESVLPLTYQWQFGADDLPGETGTMLNVLAVQPNQAGTYRVIISSADQSVVSRSALLTLVERAPSPRITGIIRTGAGTSVSFETIAGGTYTLEYKATLDAAEWVAIGSVTGTGAVRAILDPAVAEQSRFYRVRVQ